MYEIAFLENGHLVRGGIKAPLWDAEDGKPCEIEDTSDTFLHAKTMNELVSYIDCCVKAGEF